MCMSSGTYISKSFTLYKVSALCFYDEPWYHAVLCAGDVCARTAEEEDGDNCAPSAAKDQPMKLCMVRKGNHRLPYTMYRQETNIHTLLQVHYALLVPGLLIIAIVIQA